MKCYIVRYVPKGGLMPFGEPGKLGVITAESEKDGLKKLGFNKTIKDEHSGVLGGEHKHGIIYLEEIKMISSGNDLADCFA